MPAPQMACSLAFAARASLRHDAAAQVDIDPRDLLFFDTETTGRAGGTGTRAFMVVAADFHHHPDHGDGLRVRQLLIAAIAAEPDMLRAFACCVAPRPVRGSYKGRCYDAPPPNTPSRSARLTGPPRDIHHARLPFHSRRPWPKPEQ